jgi:hypothetical protein
MKSNGALKINNPTFEDISRYFASTRPLKEPPDTDLFETLTLGNGRLGTPAPIAALDIPRPMYDARTRSAQKYLTLHEKTQEIYAAAHREHGDTLRGIREDLLKNRPKPSELFELYYSLESHTFSQFDV